MVTMAATRRVQGSLEKAEWISSGNRSYPIVKIDCTHPHLIREALLSCADKGAWGNSPWIIIEMAALRVRQPALISAVAEVIAAHVSVCDGLAWGGGLLLIVADPLVRARWATESPQGMLFCSRTAVQAYLQQRDA